jgi:hypothetical protein
MWDSGPGEPFRHPIRGGWLRHPVRGGWLRHPVRGGWLRHPVRGGRSTFGSADKPPEQTAAACPHGLNPTLVSVIARRRVQLHVLSAGAHLGGALVGDHPGELGVHGSP